jgi:hypothetical protein
MHVHFFLVATLTVEREKKVVDGLVVAADLLHTKLQIPNCCCNMYFKKTKQQKQTYFLSTLASGFFFRIVCRIVAHQSRNQFSRLKQSKTKLKTNKQTNKQINKQTNKQTNKKQTTKEINKETNKQTNKRVYLQEACRSHPRIHGVIWRVMHQDGRKAIEELFRSLFLQNHKRRFVVSFVDEGVDHSLEIFHQIGVENHLLHSAVARNQIHRRLVVQKRFVLVQHLAELRSNRRHFI